MHDVAVVLPALNEEAGVSDVVRGFKAAGFEHVYVIDGSSTDRTVERAQAAGAQVIVQTGRGKGQAIRQALQDIDAAHYIFADADGTYDPTEAHKLLYPTKTGQADMVVGIRNTAAIPAFNRLGNRLFNYFLHAAYATNVHDILSGYRVINRRMARSVSLTADHFEVEAELTIEALEHGFKILELPVSYRQRIGRTKLRPLHDGANIALQLIRMVRDYKPLTVFMAAAAASLLAGIGLGAFVFNGFLATGKFTHIGTGLVAALLILLGIQFFTTGLLADMMASRLKRLERRA
jgi:dolichol-phosphate mannosyltransferase